MLTDPFAATAIRVCAQTAGRGVGARLACAGPRAEAFPIAGPPPVLAWAQALQQRQGPPARWAGRALLLLPLFLDRCAYLGRDERRDRAGAPVLRRDIARGHGTARWHGTGALGAPPGPRPPLPRLPTGRGPLLGWMLPEAPHHTPLPHGPPRAGHLAPRGQPTPDCPKRQAVRSAPGKDLTDHARFVWDDLIAGVSTPLVLGHIMGPVGGAAAHVHRSDAG